VIAALFAAVLPALADVTPDPLLNQSFEGDKNGDNIPDKWNTKGDVFRLCNHQWTSYTYDDCMMVFPPSSSGAALWQRLNGEKFSWVVVSQEGESVGLGGAWYAAKQLDWGRAYYGGIVYGPDTKYVIYTEIDGGTRNFNFESFSAVCGVTDCAKVEAMMGDGTIYELSYGFLVLPGDGYLAVDWIYFPLLG
jgi:hypothetical protein